MSQQTVQSIQNFRNCGSAVTTVGRFGFKTGTTALTAGLLSLASPVTGLVFGATSALTGLVVRQMVNANGVRNDSLVVKVAQLAVSTILSIGAAWAVCNAVGLPITFGAAVLLSAAAIPVACVVVVLAFAIVAISIYAIFDHVITQQDQESAQQAQGAQANRQENQPEPVSLEDAPHGRPELPPALWFMGPVLTLMDELGRVRSTQPNPRLHEHPAASASFSSSSSSSSSSS